MPRAVVVDDPGTGLNAAVRAGMDHLRRVPGDRSRDRSPRCSATCRRCARPSSTRRSTRATAVLADGAPAAYVADHTGEGTTLLVLARPGHGGPHFGAHSAVAHATAGAVALSGAWPGLRHDVDLPADLEQVRALGVGPATAAWPDVAVPAAPLAGCR